MKKDMLSQLKVIAAQRGSNYFYPGIGMSKPKLSNFILVRTAQKVQFGANTNLMLFLSSASNWLQRSCAIWNTRNEQGRLPGAAALEGR